MRPGIRAAFEVADTEKMSVKGELLTQQDTM